KLDETPHAEMAQRIREAALAQYDEKEKSLGIDASILRRVERDIMLQIVDAQWKDHLYGLDHLKEGIGLRGYGQRDPLVEYKKESFALFQAMKDRIDEEIVRYLWRIRPVVSEEAIPRRQAQRSLILSGGGSGQQQPAFAGAFQAASGGAALPAGAGGPRPARI